MVKTNQERKGKVLFNNTLNTFYLWLYGVGHMVKYHTDSERGNPMPHMGYSFWLTARVLLYAPSHRQDNSYHSLWYTSRGALAGTTNSSMVYPMKDRYDDPSHHEQTLLSQSYISLQNQSDCERNDMLPPLHGLFILINSKVSFICTITYTRQRNSWPFYTSYDWNKN